MGIPDDRASRDRVVGWVDQLTQPSADLARRTLLPLRATYPEAGQFISQVLVPCQHEIGRRWMRGTVTATMEHRVTALFERVVVESLPPVTATTRPSTMAVMAVQGDHHSLAPLLLTWLVAEAGGSADYLGAGVPCADLEEQLERYAYLTVGVSCATPAHLVGAMHTITSLHGHGCHVVAGGPGFGDRGEYAELLGADATAHTLVEGVRLMSLPATRSLQRPPDAERVAQATVVDREAPAIARTVVEQLEARTDLAVSPPGMLDLATVSVRATAAALLLDRPEIVAAHTCWLRELLLLRTGAGWSAPAAMRLVVEAVAEHAPDARALEAAVG